MLAFRSLALSIVLLSLAAACDWRQRPPNVLLIVIDTLRADRVGTYGNPRGLTPFLDELAARGTVFRNAYAASSWTNPSVASLFTSRYPSQHHVATFESKLSKTEVTLAEKLRPLGYWTAGYSANFLLTTALGFGQGFKQWVPLGRDATLSPDFVFLLFDQGCKSPGSRPCLLYLQYLDPHAPYAPPEPFRSRYQRDGASVEAADEANRKIRQHESGNPTAEEVDLLASLYDGEVASVDAQIRTLFAALEHRRFLDDAIIVVTADHGEEFNEHGLIGHGRSLYNDAVRVPLIIVAPGYVGGRVVEDNVSLVDVAPTLLDLVGIPAEPRFEGRSLVPLMRGTLLTRLAASFKSSAAPARLTPAGSANGAAPDVIVQLESGGGGFDLRRHTEGVVRQSVKLLATPAGQLEAYDLSADPAETHPNSGGLAIPHEDLIAALRGTRAELGGRAVSSAERAPVDEATKEKLRALGYHDF